MDGAKVVDVNSLTLGELYAMHQQLDLEVAANRAVMGRIHDRICTIEEKQVKPAPAHLRQVAEVNNLSETDLVEWMKKLPAKLKAAMKQQLESEDK